MMYRSDQHNNNTKKLSFKDVVSNNMPFCNTTAVKD